MNYISRLSEMTSSRLKSDKIQIRLSPIEKQTWTIEANKNSMTLSEFIRYHVNSSIEREGAKDKIDDKFILELFQLVEKLKTILSDKFSTEFLKLERMISEEPPYSWDL